MVITQSQMGGAQKNILLLAQQLRHKYDITVYSAPGGDLINELEKLGVRHISVDSLVREINPSKDIECYKYLVKEFEINNYDIVHCHSSKAGLLGRIAAKKAKVNKIIYTAHGFIFNEPMNYIMKMIYIFVEWLGAKKCDYIICVSSFDVEIAKSKRIIPRKKVVYIPNGISFEYDNVNIIDEGNSTSPNGFFTFGLVANFYETKGHRYLINAFNEIINKGYKARLVLIGEGMLMDEMKKLAEANPNIDFQGYISNADKIISTFDCFILSSVKEGFPFVLLEAACRKVPIISTDVGDVKEILNHGKGGIIISPANLDELEESMIYAINNRKSLIKMANQEFRYVSENYSLFKMCLMTERIYKN